MPRPSFIAQQNATVNATLNGQSLGCRGRHCRRLERLHDGIAPQPDDVPARASACGRGRYCVAARWRSPRSAASRIAVAPPFGGRALAEDRVKGEVKVTHRRRLCAAGVPLRRGSAGQRPAQLSDHGDDVQASRSPSRSIGSAPAAPDYISAARLDPDGMAIRIALSRKVKFNSIPAAERLYVDLLPETWTGVHARVCRRRWSRISPTARARPNASCASSGSAPRPQRAARRSASRSRRQPTFTRYVFEMPDMANVVPERADGKLTLEFDQPIKWDLADAKAAMPPTLDRSKPKSMTIRPPSPSRSTARRRCARSARTAASWSMSATTAASPKRRAGASRAVSVAAESRQGRRRPRLHAPAKAAAQRRRRPTPGADALRRQSPPCRRTDLRRRPSRRRRRAAPPPQNGRSAPPPAPLPRQAARRRAAPAPAEARRRSIGRRRSAAPRSRCNRAARRPPADPNAPVVVDVQPVRRQLAGRISVRGRRRPPPCSGAPTRCGWCSTAAAKIDLAALDQAIPATSIRSATLERGADGEAIVRIKLERPRLVSLEPDGPGWIVDHRRHRRRCRPVRSPSRATSSARTAPASPFRSTIRARSTARRSATSATG